MLPFQAFLSESRTRPLGRRYFGYLISLGLHAPPATVFMVSWLTQSLLIGGGSYDALTARNEAVVYRVPIALDAFFPGLPGHGSGGGSPTAGGAGSGHRGAAGPARRRARRPLHLPDTTPKVDDSIVAEPAAVGPDEHAEEDSTHHGPGGDGLGGLHGSGTGSGSGGPGGEGHGPGGMGVLAAREPRTKSRPTPKVIEEDLGTGDSLEKAFGSDDVAAVGTALQGRPGRVSMEYAAYLRTYESFPTLPEVCWPPGRTTNALLVEICVSERGTVNDVVVRQSAGADTDDFLSKAIRSWRYRPRLVAGSPRPFCHPIRIVYKKELRFDRPW